MTAKKKVLSRADFLATSANLKRELMDVPELDGSVYVRELSAKQVLEFNDRIKKLQTDNPEVTPGVSIDLMALLISMTACDSGGDLLFTESDVRALAEGNINVLINLSAKAMEVSGLNNAAVEEVTEQLKKTEITVSMDS